MRHILTACLVTSLFVGFSGASFAQGGTTPAPATTPTTTAPVKKHHRACHAKKWCHKHMHHHKPAATGTTPAPTTPAQ